MGNQRAVKLADRLSGHLPPLPSGREEGGQTRPESPGPAACLPEEGPLCGRPAAPRLCGGRGQRGPAAHWPAATTHRTSITPGGSPPADRALQESSAQHPGGLTSRPRPAMGKGWGASSAAAPSPLKTAPSHGHLGPLRTRCGRARLQRGPGLLAEKTSRPEPRSQPQPRQRQGAQHRP